MTPVRWVKDALRLSAILLCVFVGWWLYSAGYQKAEALASLRMETLKADYAKRLWEEAERQSLANLEAKAREEQLIARLVEENRQLEEHIEDLLHAAEADPDAGRVCLSPDSRMRVNQVR